MGDIDKLLAVFAANPRVFTLAFVLTCIGAWPPLAAFFRVAFGTIGSVWNQRFVGEIDAWVARIKNDAKASLDDPASQQSRMIEVIWASILPAINILLFVPLGMALVIFEPRKELGDLTTAVVGFVFVNVGFLNILLLAIEHGEHLLYRRFVRDRVKIK